MRNIFCLRRNLNLFALSIILGFLLGTYAWSVTDTTFSGKLSVATSWTHSQTGGLTTVTEQLGVLTSQTHTTGTNANQMNAFIQISGTLTNLESRQIDLTAITNTFGQANDLWRVNFLSVQTPSGTFGDLEIGAAGESPFYSIFGGTNHTAIIRHGPFLGSKCRRVHRDKRNIQNLKPWAVKRHLSGGYRRSPVKHNRRELCLHSYQHRSLPLAARTR